MEKIDELLEKYFRGETTLDDEKNLKQYFATGNVASELEPYRALFDVFDQELQEKAIVPLKNVLPKQQTVKRIWIKTFAYSGIAAAILLTLWIQRPQQTENYAVISGKKIENAEYAQQYAEKKINKAGEIIKNSLEPMHSIQTVRKSLQPMQKIAETKEKLDDIQNKIQFK